MALIPREQTDHDTPTTRGLIATEGLFNFRQLGNYNIQGTDLLTPNGLIYRSAHLEDITVKDESLLEALGISVIFDLRSRGEAEFCASFYHNTRGDAATPNPKGMLNNVIRKVHLPMVKDDFHHMAKMDEYLRAHDEEAVAERYFKLAVSESGAKAFHTILSHLLCHPGEPFLFHCSLGKDRTGLVSALILSFAGVEDSLIATEYGMSLPGLQGVRSRLQRLVTTKYPNLSSEQSDVVVDRILNLAPGSIVRVLERLRSEYGDIAGYVKEVCKLSVADIRALQLQLRAAHKSKMW